MSIKLFKAAYNAGPDRFTRYLTAAMKDRQLAEPREKPIGGRPPFREVFDGLKQGGYFGILLENAANSDQTIRVEIRRHAQLGVEKKHFLLVGKCALPMQSEEFEEAMRKTGTAAHLQKKGVDRLLIPKAVVQHWGEFPEPNQAKRRMLRVKVEQRDFRQLFNQMVNEEFLNRYLETIRFKAGRHDDASYKQALDLDKPSSSERNLSAYERFLNYSSRKVRFFNEVVDSRDMRELSALIERQFGAGRKFAEEYAGKIRDEMRRGDKEVEAFMAVAKEAENRWKEHRRG